MTKKTILCLVLAATTLIACGGQEEDNLSGADSRPTTTIQGEKGDKGDKGDKGAAVLTGEGEPAASLGADGDSYIDTATFDFYAKANGAWTKAGNIKGADGSAGQDGKDGKDGKDGQDGADGFDGKDGVKGADGKDGLSCLSGEGAPTDDLGADGDLYVDTVSFDVYKKDGGEWAKVGNIKGEKGDNGKDAISYYPNSFLPAANGFIYSDKGSYAVGEKIKINAIPDSNFELKAVEATWNGTKKIYADTTGLDDLLDEGIDQKEGGFVFKPVFVDTTKEYEISNPANIGQNGNGKYLLNQETYGTATNGVALTSEGEVATIVGNVDTTGKANTIVYLNATSTFASKYVFLKNINFVLADDFVGTTILKFAGSFASFENCTITVDKEITEAANFNCGSFGIKDVKITSTNNAASEAFLTTAIAFGNKNEGEHFSRVVVDNLTVDNVKKTSYGQYAGSVFKSYWDNLGFDFIIKNSKFGTADSKIGEMWTHFRQKDYMSGRFGMDNKLFALYKKTASVKISNTDIYTDLKNVDWYYNPALITFRIMENMSDDYTYKKNFLDIQIDVASTKVNDTTLTPDNVNYGILDTDDAKNVPLVTLYQYYDEDGEWSGYNQVNTYQAYFPYATVDSQDAKLVSGPGDYPN